MAIAACECGIWYKVEPMLKITVHDAVDQLRVELEGRLAGAWVCELEQCWHTAKAGCLHRQLTVDLTNVTFIDQAGRYLLQLMHRDGVCFVASGLMQQELAEHIMGTAE
jgi:hypothetical protein